MNVLPCKTSHTPLITHKTPTTHPPTHPHIHSPTTFQVPSSQFSVPSAPPLLNPPHPPTHLLGACMCVSGENLYYEGGIFF
jgi:hypothetical protein